MANLKKIFTWTLGLYFFSLALSLAIPNQITSLLFALLSTGLLFILLFLFAFYSGLIEATTTKGWMWLMWTVLSAVYLLYAHKWASDKVNEIFRLDPKLFPLTTHLLTIAFGPISLYTSSVWQQAHVMIIVVNSFLIFSFILIAPTLYWFFPDERSRLKKILATIGILFLIPIYMNTNSFFAWRFNNLIESFALWADFNGQYRCSNLSAEGVKKVIFIDADKVVAYNPLKTGFNRYEVRNCIYSKNNP